MSETLGQLIQRRMQDLHIRNYVELAEIIRSSYTYARELAQDTGKTRKGAYQPSPDMVSRIAAGLKVSEQEIWAATLPPTKENPQEPIFDPEGFYRELEKIPQEMRSLASRQVHSLLKTLRSETEPDTDYID